MFSVWIIIIQCRQYHGLSIVLMKETGRVTRAMPPGRLRIWSALSARKVVAGGLLWAEN